MTSPDSNHLFDLLDQWRLLPDYQLERRVDILFALYLPQILKKYLGDQSILKIIPEFPIRNFPKNGKKQTNHSFKIDYLVITATKILIVELKTENSSRSKDQDDNLKKVIGQTIYQLMEGLLAIHKVSKSKTKYDRLLTELAAEGVAWVRLEKAWENNCKEKNKDQPIPIELIYIQPTKKEESNLTVISFEEVAKIVDQNQTPLSTRFAQSLLKWQKSANEL